MFFGPTILLNIRRTFKGRHQNKKNCIFGVLFYVCFVLSHNVLFGHFLSLLNICLYTMVSVFVFLWYFLCVRMCVSGSLFVSFTFTWAYFLGLFCPILSTFYFTIINSSSFSSFLFSSYLIICLFLIRE